MRVSANQFDSLNLYSINNAYARLSEAQRKLSSGKEIEKPSDDPTGVANSLSVRNHMDTLEQYNKTLGQAKNYLSATDSALDGVANALRQARTLAVQGGGANLNNEDRIAISKQVQGVIDSLGIIGNTRFGDRYLFGGQRTDTPPFQQNGTNLVYQGGTAAKQDADIRLDISESSSVIANVSGETTVQPALQALAELRDHLLAGRANDVSNVSIKRLDSEIQNISQSRAEVGVRIQNIDRILQRNDAAKVNFSQVLSDIEDTDIPKAVVALQGAQTAYQAALQSTAQIGKLSLLDFLR